MALDISSTNELRELINLLRAEGVTQFRSGELELHIGERPLDAQATPRTERLIPDALRSLPPEYLDEGLGLAWKAE